MAAEIIVDNEFITMWYFPDKRIVHHRLHKFSYGDTLRSALEAGVEQLRKHHAHKWLSDDRSYAALTKEDAEWGETYWGPSAVEAGWRYWAIVLPKSVLGKLSMERIIGIYEKLGLTVKVFSDVDEGMAWLEAQ